MIEILNGRNCFYQWDINQKIKVNEAAIKEIHYDNGTGTALVCSVYDYNGQRVADVPNILLTNYWAIKVYAYCGECVRFENIYEVKKRSKPDDYVYTETEVKRYETLESRIEALENGGGVVVVGAVNSVNGKDGNVVLTAADVGALPENSLEDYYTKEETNTAINDAEKVLYVSVAANGEEIDCDYSEIIEQNKPVYLAFGIEEHNYLLPLVSITQETAVFSASIMGSIISVIVNSNGKIADSSVIEMPTYNNETWVFTLEDGSVITKEVLLN